MLTGTMLGIDAKQEIRDWLRTMEYSSLRNRECLYFQRAGQELDEGRTYFAEVLVDRMEAHYKRCMNDPTIVQYQGRRLLNEISRMGAYRVLLENLNRHRN